MDALTGPSNLKQRKVTLNKFAPGNKDRLRSFVAVVGYALKFVQAC